MSRTPKPFVLCLAFAFTSAVALSITACSSGDVAVGSTGGALVRRDGGAPTGDGATCSWDDTISSDGTFTPTPNGPYALGDTFPAPDGCNVCQCTAYGISCTEKGCPPADSGGVTCKYHGHEWTPGAKIPLLDGCNTTTCQSDGSLTQTEIACLYVCPPETVIDCEPIVPEERLVKCYGPYHTWIRDNCPGVGFAL